MKALCAIFTTTLLFAKLSNAFSQSFVNLDFEQAKNLGSQGSAVAASSAFPGWTISATTTFIFYDNLTLGASAVDILDTNATPLVGYNPVMQGHYTAVLQAGDGPGTYPNDTNVSISQSGLVPASASSLLFEANGTGPEAVLLLSLGGQNVNFFALATGSNYTLYGADISAFAGQVETLEFTSVYPNGVESANTIFLDNIQFSSTAVPEPSAPALAALGLAGLSLCRRKLSL